MAVMQVLAGPETGKVYTVERERTILGRHPDCDIVLDVAAVSRQHARILRSGNAYFLEDLGSRNGTFINGRMIQAREMLKEGDRVKICDMDFAFHVGDADRNLPGEGSSMALIVDDEENGTSTKSTVMSTLDVSSSRSGAYLSARPEVKLRAMMEIANNLSRAVSLEAVLPKLLDSLFKIFLQADRGFIVLQESGGAPLVPKAVKHRRSDDEGTIRISRTIVRKAMESREAILSADAASDERFDMAQSIADFQIRSLICVPLIDSDGRALGVIQIDTLDQRNRFNSDDLEVLASIAAQAAAAIENAQLHERAVEQEVVQRDLDLARKVQRGMLPTQPPEVPGYHFFSFYQAARQVGGDYYDYVPLSGGRIAVVLGDVSGKGVAAAIVMAKLSGDVRFCLASENDPVQALRRVNTMLGDRRWEDRFVTFLLAILDPTGHEITVVNAGHMPPLLRRASGEVEEIGSNEAGVPLGVMDDAEYRAYRCKLDVGDSLTLYTDGISEAMNADNEFYRAERLRLALTDRNVALDELGKHILADVRRFVGGHTQNDDMCVTVFGRTDA